MLLCGRLALLHRGMGDGSPPCPASIYLDGTILLHNSTDCKVISNGPKGPFFVVQRAAVYGDSRRVEPGCWARARHKAGNKVGSAPWNIPAVGLGETRGLVPVGYSVAVIP